MESNRAGGQMVSVAWREAGGLLSAGLRPMRSGVWSATSCPDDPAVAKHQPTTGHSTVQLSDYGFRGEPPDDEGCGNPAIARGGHREKRPGGAQRVGVRLSRHHAEDASGGGSVKRQRSRRVLEKPGTSRIPAGQEVRLRPRGEDPWPVRHQDVRADGSAWRTRSLRSKPRQVHCIGRLRQRGAGTRGTGCVETSDNSRGSTATASTDADVQSVVAGRLRRRLQ